MNSCANLKKDEKIRQSTRKSEKQKKKKKKQDLTSSHSDDYKGLL